MKLMKVLVAALVMAAMVTPAIAEDRLKLSGSMQVRGFYTDYDLESGYNGNTPLLGDDREDSAAWNDQRLRIGGQLAVAEGVSVVFRFDAGESLENNSDPAAWSSSTLNGSAYRYTQRRGDIQFDLAYLQLQKNGFTLMAGSLYHGGFGITRAFHDATSPGFIVKYGAFTLDHSKNSEENAGNETLSVNALEGDSSTTAIEYVFKGEGFSLTPIVAYTADSTVNDQDIMGLGLAMTAKLGPVDLKGEVDYFDGEDAANKDWKGLQFYLDGSMAASDTVRVGFQGLYAEGQDAGDGQVTSLSRDFVTDWAFADFNPQSLGSGDFAYSDNFDIFDPGKFHGASGAGVVAGGLYANVKASDAMSLSFSGMMFETEDDDIADMDGFFLNALANYKLTANTTLSGHLNYMSIDNDDLNTSDEALGFLTTLAVSF